MGDMREKYETLPLPTLKDLAKGIFRYAQAADKTFN